MYLKNLVSLLKKDHDKFEGPEDEKGDLREQKRLDAPGPVRDTEFAATLKPKDK